jgi:hypothetical protein
MTYHLLFVLNELAHDGRDLVCRVPRFPEQFLPLLW